MITESIKNLVRQACLDLRFQVEEIELEHPENPEHGDYSTNIALALGQKLGRNPREIAESIVSNFDIRPPRLDGPLRLGIEASESRLGASDFLDKVEVAGPGFINFFLSREYFLQEFGKIVKQKNKYDAGKEKKKIIVEYSSPNIAKSFGMGHLRSTIIGQAIYNLYAFLGYKCIGINYPGDWGTPHGKILYQLYETKLKGETAKEQKKILNSLTIEDLERLYVDFHTELAANPAMEQEARAWFKKLEQNNTEARTIWEAARKISLREFERIYDFLNVHIDHLIGESFFEDKMEEIVKEFKRKRLARESEGALIIPFPNDELPPAMLLKSDGATTYFTRDLANMKYRIKRWKPNMIVIETGVEQILHFKQVFLAAKLAGIVDKEKLMHITHGLYRNREGKFSTRKGQTVHLEEVLEGAIERAKGIIRESETGRDLSSREQQEVAKAVGIGGIKYNDLSQHPAGDIVFDWEKILNLKGNSAPYLQYTYARCKSILRKVKVESSLLHSSILLTKKLNLVTFSQEEENLLRLLYRFGEVVREAAEKFSPNLMCDFVFDVAQRYNLFYNTSPVLKAETKALKDFRLLLTAAVAQIIKNSLSLLGIKTLERM